MIEFALDSSAVVAWILQEDRRRQGVDALLKAPGARPILPGPALAESIFVARRAGNTSSAEQIATTLSAMGMVVEPAGEADMVRAARLLEVSAANPGLHPATGDPLTLSLGDAMILAVTERLGIKVLTGDRYWSQLAKQGHTSARVVQF